MNIGILLGFAAAATIFVTTIVLSFDNPFVLVDFKSALIVVGGTFAAAMICFPLGQLIVLVKLLFTRTFQDQANEMVDLVDELKKLAVAARGGRNAFEKATKEIKHHFLRDGAEILFWTDEDITDGELRELLITRAEMQHERNSGDATQIKTISQFPPAFGLMGTTIGMISLLQGLSEDGGGSLGQSMAIALITTLYGLFFANIMLIPMSENLIKQSHNDNMARLMVVDCLMLIHEKKPPRYVEDYALSFLAPRDRPKK